MQKLLALLLSGVAAYAAQPDFAHRALLPQHAHAAVADLDGDGRKDLVLHSSEDTPGAGWQPFPGGAVIPITSHAVTGDRLALADLDGDGDIDLLSAVVDLVEGKRKYRVVWFENPRPGRDVRSPGEWQEHAIGVIGDYMKDLGAADLDRDGRLDVVARTHRETRVYLQRGVPDGTPWPERVLTHDPHEGMALADLDLDGRPDIILNGFWFHTPIDVEQGEFSRHTIDAFWYGPNTKDSAVLVADFDHDGLPDVALSATEKDHMPVAIYFQKSRADLLMDRWERHEVLADFGWCQTFDVGDYDLDGHPDLLVGKFERQRAGRPENSAPFEVMLLRNADGRGRQWEPRELSKDGMYAGVLADWGGDGDLDVLGQRTYWGGPMKLFENLASDRRASLDRWTALTIDDTRTRHPKYRNGGGGWFGLAAGRFTDDAAMDLVCGQWLYRNPGGDLTGKWERTEIAGGVDAMLAVDVDGDGRDDVFAMRPGEQLWCKPTDALGRTWDVKTIGRLPLADHGTSSQGTALGQLIPGGKPEIIVTGGGIVYFEIPADPTQTPWPSRTIAPQGSNGEGVVARDVDGDGLVDIVAAYLAEGTDQKRDGAGVAWWRNPGTATGTWVRHDIGRTIHAADRFVAADLNGDGRTDIAVTEERSPGLEPDGNFFWFEAPADPAKGSWKRHLIVTQFSMNNLDGGDLDGDGDFDLVTAEHRGPHLRVQIWENNGRGTFLPREAARGREMHLGARLFDLNGDGKPEIVGTGWSAFGQLHVLRNDNLALPVPAPESASGTIVAQVTLAADVPLYDALAELSFDFTAAMREQGVSGAFDPRSLLVQELDANGKPRPEPVPHQLERTRAATTLFVYLAGESAAGSTRKFQITFGAVPRQHEVPRLITVIDGVVDAGEPAFKVVTPNSFFFVQKKSHGISSLIDRNRQNWVSYSSTKGSAGDFRGLPNVAPVEFHPGRPTGKKDLKLIVGGPLRAVFEGMTTDDKWKTRWEVNPTYTRIILTAPGDTAYWFLYEGTPGGKLAPEQQYMLLSDGSRLPLSTRWQRDLPAPEWAAFGDPVRKRVLFVAHPEDDAIDDTYWPMEGNMTVFGFGRGVTTNAAGKKRSSPLMTAPTNTMLFGFVDTEDPAEVTRRVKSSLATVRLEVVR